MEKNRLKMVQTHLKETGRRTMMSCDMLVVQGESRKTDKPN